VIVEINGEKKVLSDEEPVTIEGLFQALNLPTQAIAVAVNAEVIPRSEFGKISVRNRDRIEIIRPVGGG